MSTPNLQITVDNSSNGAACYLPLAARAAGERINTKIAVRLQIANMGSVAVTVKHVDFSFPGSGYGGTSLAANNPISPGSNLEWENGLGGVIYLDGPAPTEMSISVHCDGFSTAKSLTLGLAPFPIPGGADKLLFPYAHADLRAGERMTSTSKHWTDGPHGTQMYAHDVMCIGPDGSSWTELLPGRDGMSNGDFRIYGKPVRAIADGTIVASTDWHEGMEANTLVKSNGQYQFPSNIGSDQAYGNFVLVTSGNFRVLYAHLQKNTVFQALGSHPTGVAVKAGQVLGLAGNTGNATAPHTHMQCERVGDRAPWGLPFSDALVVDKSLVSATQTNVPWTSVVHQGIPGVPSLILPYARWSGWREDLGGGTLASAPASVLDGAGHLHVFAQGFDGNIWHSWWNGSAWSGWRDDLGAGQLTSAPAVALDGGGWPHVFARGADGNIWHTWWSGSAWSGWRADLGKGHCKAAPVAALDEQGHLHVFVQGDDDNLWHSYWTGSQWRGWKADLGKGQLTSQPAVVSHSGTLHVFARGADRDIWHTYSSGGDWSGWHSHLGQGTFQSDPSAVVFPDGDVHVFAQGDDRNIWHTFWNGSVWSGWRADLGSGTLIGKPVALLDSHGWLHVFAQGDDRNIWHSFWNGQVWSGWRDDLGAGGRLDSTPSALAYPTGDVHVFAQGDDGNIRHSFLHW